jgi:hypothetical protein
MYFTDDITRSTNCKYRTDAKLNTLEARVFFRYIIVNTLHKVDNKDDDDDYGNNNNNNNNNRELYKLYHESPQN